jgi:hypothetical protein
MVDKAEMGNQGKKQTLPDLGRDLPHPEDRLQGFSYFRQLGYLRQLRGHLSYHFTCTFLVHSEFCTNTDFAVFIRK